MSDLYRLDGRVPVKCEDVSTWVSWLSTTSRQLALDRRGGVVVSTVFRGVDYNLGAEGTPLVFETIVFGGPLDLEQERYSTWEEAEAGHAAMCAKVFRPRGLGRLLARIWAGVRAAVGAPRREPTRDVKLTRLCPYDRTSCETCDDPHDIAPTCYVDRLAAVTPPKGCPPIKPKQGD